MAEGVAPPGWYADPENPSALRYWDGRAWAAPGPPPPPAGAYPPSITYVVQKRSTNGFAIASMVLGILWHWIGSVLALVFGYVAKRQIKASDGEEAGGGMATAGIVLGWVGVAAGILVIVLVIAVSSHSSSSTSQTSACVATKDASVAASAAYEADNGTWPTSFSDLTNANVLVLPADATVSGRTLLGNGWTLTMSGGGSSPNTFACTG